MREKVFKFACVVAGIVLSYYIFNPILNPYWEKHKKEYDPKLQQYRCIDKNTGEIMEMDPPCYVLTLAGRYAIEKRVKKCVEKGGNEDDCTTEAYKWSFKK